VNLALPPGQGGISPLHRRCALPLWPGSARPRAPIHPPTFEARVSDEAKLQGKKKDEGGLMETVKVIVQALLIALVIRTFLFQPFNIPSGSLIPTLLVGDYLFVSKYTYGYSKHSVPFSPDLFAGRVWASEPKRGDIAVFKLPKDNATDYIKRVIGMPGDRIQVIDGVVHINNTAVKRERIADFETADAWGRPQKVAQYRETLPGGVSHVIIERDGDRGYWDNTRVYTVPAGHYFMMGDNRDNSTDSRDEQSVGPVPFENFVGRAEIIFFSIEEGEAAWQIWRWPVSVRWNRLFQSIK
jgi:signal peptidase I